MKHTLDGSVNHRIAHVAALLKRQVFRLIAENGIEITPEQWTLLYYLWQQDGLTIGELVDKSKKDFANVTRIINKLNQRHYVSKKRSDSDRRSYRVYLTPQALSIRQPVETCWQQSLDISLRNVSRDEQDNLLRLLQKIEINTSAYLDEHKPR